MKTRVTVNKVLIGASIVVACLSLWLLYVWGNEEAFNVVLGVVVGAVVTTVPQWLSRRTERLRRARAASVLLRSDLYGFQNWIARSLRASKWDPLPADVSTADHLAELAYAIPSWEKWQQLGQARRYMNLLIGMSERSQPDDESRRHAWETFKAIDRARALLAKVDDGPNEPHWAIDEVRIAVAIAAATSSRRKTKRRLG